MISLLFLLLAGAGAEHRVSFSQDYNSQLLPPTEVRPTEVPDHDGADAIKKPAQGMRISGFHPKGSSYLLFCNNDTAKGDRFFMANFRKLVSARS